jgi:hypothetical protein
MNINIKPKAYKISKRKNVKKKKKICDSWLGNYSLVSKYMTHKRKNILSQNLKYLFLFYWENEETGHRVGKYFQIAYLKKNLCLEYKRNSQNHTTKRKLFKHIRKF